MTSIIGGVCMPHHPLITGETEVADPGQASQIRAALDAVRRGVTDLNADTVIVIAETLTPCSARTAYRVS